jgi:phage/plasmid-associated DNA primase
MNKERIILMDGAVDISGPYIAYTQKEPEEEKLIPLPYTVAALANAKKPPAFLKFLEETFPDKKTAETALYYLSLIISKNTELGYGGFFIGPPRTGKTTLIEILTAALPGYICRAIFREPPWGHRGFFLNQKDIIKNDGAGALVVSDVNLVNTDTYNSLTSGKPWDAGGFGEKPYQFIPTAQCIIISNYFPHFTDNEKIDQGRVIAFPFVIRRPAGCIPVKKLIDNLQPEFPAVVKLLADTYVILKHKLNGVIPQSGESKRTKRMIFSSCWEG